LEAALHWLEESLHPAGDEVEGGARRVVLAQAAQHEKARLETPSLDQSLNLLETLLRQPYVDRTACFSEFRHLCAPLPFCAPESEERPTGRSWCCSGQRCSAPPG